MQKSAYQADFCCESFFEMWISGSLSVFSALEIESKPHPPEGCILPLYYALVGNILTNFLICAPCWDRTNDLSDVNGTLYH